MRELHIDLARVIVEGCDRARPIESPAPIA
jgi:hypothetical protein